MFDPGTLLLKPRAKGKRVQTPLRLPQELLLRIDEIAEEGGYSRNATLEHFVQWALAQYDRQVEKKRGRRGNTA